MKLQVCGYRKVDFDDRNTGGKIKGLKVFGVVKDEISDGLIGDPTTSIWIPDNSPHYPVTIAVGDIATVYFKQGGKAIDYFTLAPRKA